MDDVENVVTSVCVEDLKASVLAMGIGGNSTEVGGSQVGKMYVKKA